MIENFLVNKNVLQKFDKEIIIDVDCACAVLRGANIYAPGIIGMTSGIYIYIFCEVTFCEFSGTKVGDKVSVYADLSGKCKKGLMNFDNSSVKVFIGNGISQMQRYQLFGDDLKPWYVKIQIS